MYIRLIYINIETKTFIRIIEAQSTNDKKTCNMRIVENEVGKIFVGMLELEIFDRVSFKVGKFKMKLERS